MKVSKRLEELTSSLDLPLGADDSQRLLHRWGVPDRLEYDRYVLLELDDRTTDGITFALGLAPDGDGGAAGVPLLDLERFPRVKTKNGRQRLSRLLATLSKWRSSNGAVLDYPFQKRHSLKKHIQ